MSQWLGTPDCSAIFLSQQRIQNILLTSSLRDPCLVGQCAVCRVAEGSNFSGVESGTSSKGEAGISYGNICEQFHVSKSTIQSIIKSTNNLVPRQISQDEVVLEESPLEWSERSVDLLKTTLGQRDTLARAFSRRRRRRRFENIV